MGFKKSKIHKLYEMLESRSGHWIIGTIVIINALILGIQTFKNVPHDISEYLHHIDQIILGLFVLELIIKLLAGKLSFFKSGWNVFDFLIIVGSLFPHQDFLPVLRAFRALHLMSMMDASPKMRHVLSGLWKALPGVSNVLSILILFFYISSVMGVFLFRDAGVAEFQNLGIAMKTMFQVLTGDDWANIMHNVEKVSEFAWVYFISFYIVLVFIILNLFIGVVVGSLQAAEEEIYQDKKHDEISEILKDLKDRLDKLDKKISSPESTKPPL